MRTPTQNRRKVKKARPTQNFKNSPDKWEGMVELSPDCAEVKPNDLARIRQNSLAWAQLDVYTVPMDYDTVVAADASGNWSYITSDNPNGDSNWSTSASFFDEYRTLATELTFYANTTSGGNLSTYAPIVSVVDMDNSASLTGYTLAAQYSSVKNHRGNQDFKVVAYMSGSENAGYLSTASPASRYWIKLYSSGNSASITLGRIHIRHWVQFRGKGI